MTPKPRPVRVQVALPAPAKPTPPELLTPQQVADMLSVAIRTVSRCLANPQGPSRSAL